MRKMEMNISHFHAVFIPFSLDFSDLFFIVLHLHTSQTVQTIRKNIFFFDRVYSVEHIDTELLCASSSSGERTQCIGKENQILNFPIKRRTQTRLSSRVRTHSAYSTRFEKEFFHCFALHHRRDCVCVRMCIVLVSRFWILMQDKLYRMMNENVGSLYLSHTLSVKTINWWCMVLAVKSMVFREKTRCDQWFIGGCIFDSSL